MKKVLKTNKNYQGEECWGCKQMIKEKHMTQKEIDKSHKDCHGWFHCGNDCCGECLTCGK